ncbi:hypothetical protein Bca52824_011193 [Brassica carinata]|uniref:Uncharacterized protein n=1 Tax=Brassica carinata TaxID=52824 RepID=A0A8X8BAW0_BRACI|nr:hypothetical protein Bca52824_011193 [Brassica carinata]
MRTTKHEQHRQIMLGRHSPFTYDELARATNGFSEVNRTRQLQKLTTSPLFDSTRLCWILLASSRLSLICSVSSFFDFNESGDGETSEAASEEVHGSYSGGDPEAESRDDDVSIQG